MPMTRNDFLNAIIDDGVMEITIHYTRPNQQDKKDGAIKGLEICRGKNDSEILALLEQAKACVDKATVENDGLWYWHWVAYQRQIEWVLNVLSAALREHGRPPLTDCTLRGYMKAANILNGKVYEGVTH